MLPHFDLANQMWPAAAGIALMSFTETIAAARAFGSSAEPRPDANQELLALGAANVVGGLLGAMPSGGGTSQTAVNRLAGARSQVSALITATMALATLLLLGPVIALMPQAALAAVVIVYSIELIKPAEFAAISRVRRTEFLWALTAFAGVVLLGTLKGIMVAVVVSLLSLAQQAYNPVVYPLGRKRGTALFRPLTPERPDDETWPGLLILRTEGRLFFANAEGIADKVRALVDLSRPRVLVIDGRAIFDIEYTALQMLTSLDERLAAGATTLWLAGLNPETLAVVRRSPLGERLGQPRMFANVDAAVREYDRRYAAHPVPGSTPSASED
jgi:MFS superfamily sulfate permease-like transporter